MPKLCKAQSKRQTIGPHYALPGQDYCRIHGGFRRWTEEDLAMFAAEDQLDPERAQRLKAFISDISRSSD